MKSCAILPYHIWGWGVENASVEPPDLHDLSYTEIWSVQDVTGSFLLSSVVPWSPVKLYRIMLCVETSYTTRLIIQIFRIWAILRFEAFSRLRVNFAISSVVPCRSVKLYRHLLTDKKGVWVLVDPPDLQDLRFSWTRSVQLATGSLENMQCDSIEFGEDLPTSYVRYWRR